MSAAGSAPIVVTTLVIARRTGTAPALGTMSSSNASKTVLGAYQLDERIGEGGFSEVFRAHGPDGEVALKLLGEDVDGETLRRFEREVEVLGRIRHPNLIRLLDHGVDPERGPYLVTPLLAGLTFRDLLPATGLGPEAALLLIRPVLRALGAMHAAGLIHRDLKPENAMIGTRGDVTLVDLGLARGLEQSRLTRSGAVAGSVPYMSPEQIEGADTDTRSDVWSIGVMLYEMVCGRRPFSRERSGEEVAAILSGRFAPLSERDRRTSRELDGLLDACLAADVDARPEDANALLDEVDALIDWTPPSEHRREIVMVISDLDAYHARTAERRIGQLHEHADDLAADPFTALAVLDRALAYRPDDEETLSRIEAVSSGAAESGLSTHSTDPLAPTARAVPKSTRPPPRQHSATRARPTPRTPTPVRDRRGPSRLMVLGAGLAVVVVAVAGGYHLGHSDDAAENPEETLGAGVEDVSEGAEASQAGPDAEDEPADDQPAAPLMSPLPPAPRAPVAGLDELREIPAGDLEGGEAHDLEDNVAGPGEPIVPARMLGANGPAAALRQMQAAYDRNPGDPDTRVWRALTLLGNDREAEGLAELDAVAAAHPDNATVWGALGFVRMRQNRIAEAERALSRAITLDPEDAASLRNRGILRHRQGRRPEAYADLMAALRLDPSDVNTLGELSQIYSRSGHQDDARPLLERVVRARPRNPNAWLDLSMVQPDVDQSLASVERALALAPDLRRAHVRRCAVLARAQRNGAIEACAEAAERAPGDPWVVMHRGLARYHLGETAAALRDMDAAIAQRPDDDVMLSNRYLVRMHAGQTEAALADLRRACELGNETACSESASLQTEPTQD